MAKSKYKCPSCGKYDDEDNMVLIGARHYHQGECEQKQLDEIERKKENRDAKDKVFEYLCELYEIDKPTGFMFKQLETFRKNYGYTDDGIYLTLKYYYETLENEVNKDMGLGIIPYYYEQAKQHYIDIWTIEDLVGNFVEEEKVNRINIKPINREYIDKNKKLINFNIIKWEDEDE